HAPNLTFTKVTGHHNKRVFTVSIKTLPGIMIIFGALSFLLIRIPTAIPQNNIVSLINNPELAFFIPSPVFNQCRAIIENANGILDIFARIQIGFISGSRPWANISSTLTESPNEPVNRHIGDLTDEVGILNLVWAG